MTGLEHYQTAEDLLRSPNLDAQGVAEAPAHATLALVWAHNRTQTELNSLLHTMLDQIREHREATS